MSEPFPVNINVPSFIVIDPTCVPSAFDVRSIVVSIVPASIVMLAVVR